MDPVGLDREIQWRGSYRRTLVDAGSDENRWAQSYTRRCRNPLSMQSEVAAAIARDVNAAVLAKEEASGISLPRDTLIGPINDRTVPAGHRQ